MAAPHFSKPVRSCRKCSQRQKLGEEISYLLLCFSLSLGASMETLTKKIVETRTWETQLAGINQSLDTDLTLGSQIKEVWKMDLKTKFYRTRIPLFKRSWKVGGRRQLDTYSQGTALLENSEWIYILTHEQNNINRR